MANMRCTVKFLLDQVTCPGTLHLPDRKPVYLTIFLFGRFQRSQNVYPSFPMCFTTKIKFQRLFTNAKTPEQLLEILEDETILIELRQHTKGLKGGRILAEFEESTRSFLFPSPSYIPSKNQIKRDVLLTRTDHFSKGKGIDPQFRFRTKTYIEEGAFIHATHANISVNRQIPASEVSPAANIHNRSIKHNRKNRKSSSPKVRITEPDEIEITEHVQESVHCVCECPLLNEEPGTLEYWLETLNKKKKKKGRVKPFRTGKEPKQLLSKRDFTDSFKKEKLFGRKGICKYCAVPLPSCVLCNAYKSVYGPISFLMHRFQKVSRTNQRMKRKSEEKNEGGGSESPGRDGGQAYDSSRYTPKQTAGKRVGTGILKSDEKHKSNNYSISSCSGEDKAFTDDTETYKNATVLTPRSCTRASSASPLFMDERSFRSLPRKSKPTHSRLFNSSAPYSHSDDTLYTLESDRVHERIKNLMKKNNSVLQYDLSSSESITGDDDDIQNESLSPDSSPDDSPRYAPVRRNLPNKSFVEPLASEKKWLNRSGNNDGQTHREKLDSRLRAIYADLYQKTLNNS